MIASLTLILLCQLVGELLTNALRLPIPGPVIGMALLFVLLLIRGQIPQEVGQTADGLLRAMSLLFVPAGAGVVIHFKLLGAALAPLAAAIAVSTLATIVVTALMMRWLSRRETPDG